MSVECPFSKGLVLSPPSEALGALNPEFYPGQYGPEVRNAIRREYGDINEETIDAIELQRHLTPIVERTYEAISTTDPRELVAKHDLGNHNIRHKDLSDLRGAIQAEMRETALQTYAELYNSGEGSREIRTYHDHLAARYLADKERSGKTAIDRLLDGVGTAVGVPYKLMTAFEDFVHAEGIPPTKLADITKNSWRMLHRVAEMDLAGYTFWTGAILERQGSFNGDEIYPCRFSNSQWSRLVTFDPESLTFSLDTSPHALGKYAIDITETSIARWNRVITAYGATAKRAETGADRLRCPITRMPKELTIQYAALWAEAAEHAGLWSSPEATNTTTAS